MKRNFRVLGFAAIMSLAAFSFTACGGNDNAATETETEVVTEEVEVVDDQGTEVMEVEVDSTEVTEGEGKCGEGKCGEGKCG
jgi:uncharacterized low-complexity protein